MGGELNLPTTIKVAVDVEVVVVVQVVLIWNAMSVVSLVILLGNVVLVEVEDVVAAALGTAEAPAMVEG